jgi:hypothetical protein
MKDIITIISSLFVLVLFLPADYIRNKGNLLARTKGRVTVFLGCFTAIPLTVFFVTLAVLEAVSKGLNSTTLILGFISVFALLQNLIWCRAWTIPPSK